jgi:hypothetical protein
MAELTLNFDPKGSALRLFLKALLRIRIATVTELRSFGELAKESVLVLPALSVSGASSKVNAAF